MAWFQTVPGALDRLCLDADVIDEESVQRAVVTGGRLEVSTESYGVIILPAATVIDEATAERLDGFVAAGGLLVAVEALPDSPRLRRHFEAAHGVAAPEGAAPSKAISDEAVSDETTLGEAVPGEVASEEGVLPEGVPRRGRSAVPSGVPEGARPGSSRRPRTSGRRWRGSSPGCRPPSRRWCARWTARPWSS